jgi:squalene synthase HpnC
VTAQQEPLARAYAACEALVRSHYENFPVASRLLPAAMRPHIAAVYAFARVADDFADEGSSPADVRQSRLGRWQARLHEAVGSPDGVRRSADHDEGNTERGDLILAAVAHSIRSLDLPLVLFDDLVSAFCQDTTTTRYATWRDVFDYCRRSANPVGRLVLRIAGYRNDALDRSSDALCTALQLTNFWQDFGRDWRAGRLYVPREAQDACGAAETDLKDARLSSAWVRAIESGIAVTREQFRSGRGVCDEVSGRLRVELRLTWLGGARVLEGVRRRTADLLEYRPTIGAADVPVLLWQAAMWRRAPA